MTPDEAALYDERGFLVCPKCGGKMRPTTFNTLIQGWDEGSRQAMHIRYTGDRKQPTETIEQPPEYKPSEVQILGVPAVACRRCNVLKIHPDMSHAVDWARKYLLPAKNRDTVPWEVVKHAMAQQQS